MKTHKDEISASLTVSNTRPAPYRLLDAWRGVACLAVLAVHWQDLAVHYAPELTDKTVYRLAEYGFLGVQIFFVISGFCIVASADGLLRKFIAQFAPQKPRPSVGGVLKTYLIARARRVFPTYWAGIAFILLFYWAATQLARAGYIPQNVYTHFDATQLAPVKLFANLALLAIPLNQDMILVVAWTLCYEVAFYAIIGLALGIAAWLLSRRKNGGHSTDILLNLLHGVTLCSMLGLCLAPRHVPFPLELWPQFGLGIFLYDLLMGTNPKRKRAVAFALGGVLLLGFIFVVFCNSNVGAMQKPARLTFPVSAVFTLLLLATYRHDTFLMSKIWIRGLGFVGLFSYSLYLTHTVTLRLAGQLLQRLHLIPRFHLLAFVFAIAFSVGAAYLFFLLFEKPILSLRKIEREPVP